MALEIERKFRVIDERWRAAASGRTLLRQGYLANTARASIRVRLAGEAGWLSVKAMRPGRSRAEYEVAIAAADAHAMLSELCEGAAIEKWRHIVVHDGERWEVDEFLGANAGLVIAELELATEQQRFAHPAWLGPEVTDEERFYNFRLAQHPYSQWSGAERGTP